MNRYTIISGYYHAPEQRQAAEWFYELWSKHHENISPDRDIRIIANGGCEPPAVNAPHRIIYLEGNCGHVHSLIGKQKPAKPHGYCGWSSVVLAGAMLCYANETDMAFVEQDCLMFGDCIGRMYEELGGGGMIFGKSQTMPSAQSLFLIRHETIPWFVSEYMRIGPDRSENLLPEHKFWFMQQEHPTMVKQFSFGYDRDRPYKIQRVIDGGCSEDHCFYLQKTTPAELRQLEEFGYLELPPNMPAVKAFTGDTTGL